MISLLPQRLRAAGAGNHMKAGADRCENTMQAAMSADWLRLARTARALSWITLAWMGIEGG